MTALGRKLVPTFPPVGVCIYCGAREYVPGSGHALRSEHIVPYGLNGEVELPQASCRRCERITGAGVEGMVLRTHLLGSRAAMGLRSRRKRLSDPLPLFVGKDGRTRIELPPGDCPAVLLLLQLPDPPLLWELNGWGMPAYDHPPFIRWFDYHPALLRERYGVDAFAPPALVVPTFCRMVAKIGHAWATAQLGHGKFVPLLAEHLCDEDLASRAILPFVGGLPPSPPRPALHFLKLDRVQAGGLSFIVASVRLFAFLGTPTYRVVVGLEHGQGPTRLPDVRVPEDVLRYAYRSFVRVE